MSPLRGQAVGTTAPRINAVTDRESGLSWFLEFLRRELAPYPGRISLVARMTLATTLAMLVINTFHVPAGALGGYFALVISRESLRNTVQNTWLTIAFFSIAAVYVFVGVALFVDSPVTHFLWVLASFYLIFFVMGAAKNYGLAAGFSFMIATAIPIWDSPGGLNTKVALTFYTLLSVIIGSVSTLFVELVYRIFGPQDPVIAGVADRLHSAAGMLGDAANGRPPRKEYETLLLQYAMVGPSSLRQNLIRSGLSPELRARASAVVSISGRVVELCAAAIPEVGRAPGPSAADRERLLALGDVVGRQAAAVRRLPDVSAIGSGKVPRWTASEEPSQYIRELPAMERSVHLLGEIFSSFGSEHTMLGIAQSGTEQARDKSKLLAIMLGAKPSQAFVPDAFRNRDHLVFALRGALAATLCYLVYNGADWPGINTAVATCIITALATIGSSRQKQLLRIAGAFIGGFLISLPAQVFLLPYLDSIDSFTIFFATVTALASWISTSSPRLSYCGLQIALAFYLVNLQEPFEQISLSVSRDRVVGVLLGLVAMWLVFDRISAPLASTRMNALLGTNLRLLGDLARTVAEACHGASRDPGGSTAKDAIKRSRELRDQLNSSFSEMNAQADAVQFEFGPDRDRRLRERERMQAMQPPMRSLFLLQIALLEPDVLPGRAMQSMAAETTPAVRDFLERNGDALQQIASIRAQGSPAGDPRSSSTPEQVQASVAAVQQSYKGVDEQLRGERSTLLTLCGSIASAIQALEDAALQPFSR